MSGLQVPAVQRRVCAEQGLDYDRLVAYRGAVRAGVYGPPGLDDALAPLDEDRRRIVRAWLRQLLNEQRDLATQRR
jgi:hypothetical protein